VYVDNLLHFISSVPSLLRNQRSSLDHQTHNLEQDIGSSNDRQLSLTNTKSISDSRRRRGREVRTYLGVIGSSDLDEIGTDEGKSLESSKDRAELSGRPSSRLWRTRSGGSRRVEDIDIDGWRGTRSVEEGEERFRGRTEVDGSGSDCLADLVDDTLSSDTVDGASLDERESTVGIAGSGASQR
jgi:hypothetical protein